MARSGGDAMSRQKRSATKRSATFGAGGGSKYLPIIHLPILTHHNWGRDKASDKGRRTWGWRIPDVVAEIDGSAEGGGGEVRFAGHVWPSFN